MAKGEMKIEASAVYAPTLGIIGNIPPTMLDPRAFTNCDNIRLKDGVARNGKYNWYTTVII